MAKLIHGHTATVSLDQKIKGVDLALVYGQAELADDVVVLDSAQVSGHVKLGGDVRVTGNCWLSGSFQAKAGHFYKNARVQEKAERIR